MNTPPGQDSFAKQSTFTTVTDQSTFLDDSLMSPISSSPIDLSSTTTTTTTCTETTTKRTTTKTNEPSSSWSLTLESPPLHVVDFLIQMSANGFPVSLVSEIGKHWQSVDWDSFFQEIGKVFFCFLFFVFFCFFVFGDIFLDK
jgi:hypothetical protein